jgi:hypothetical protein
MHFGTIYGPFRFWDRKDSISVKPPVCATCMQKGTIFGPFCVYNAANEERAVDSQVVGITSEMKAATPIDSRVGLPAPHMPSPRTHLARSP